MRRYLVAGNWKLNMGPAAGRELAQGLADLLKGRELKGDVLVCPPYVSIPAVGEVAKGDPVLLGAQNCADQAGGAFTGEVSAEMLAEAGCQTGVLPRLEFVNAYNTVLAYEPVWAIGTGETATPEMAQQMHAYSRKTVADLLGQEVADYIRILYGGSCKPGNARELIGLPDVDGGLIGGASLKAADFVGIVDGAEAAQS
jgi:triosephosphate isomerase